MNKPTTAYLHHILIFDHTTPIGVMKLPFSPSKFTSIEEWYKEARKYLTYFALSRNLDISKLSFNLIKMYDYSKKEI